MYYSVWYQTTYYYYARRHFILFTNCHVSWNTLYFVAASHFEGNVYFLFLAHIWKRKSIHIKQIKNKKRKKSYEVRISFFCHFFLLYTRPAGISKRLYMQYIYYTLEMPVLVNQR